MFGLIVLDDVLFKKADHSRKLRNWQLQIPFDYQYI